jgi:hypothetical protein
MPRYSVFGVTLESDWELPDLGTGTGDVSARIARGRFPIPPAAGDGLPHWWADDERAFILDPSAGSIRIAGGSEILVEPVEPIDWSVLNAWLLGPALAILLHQRGLLVLHSSVLARDSRAIAILGDCGAGKSTTAFLLCQRGWQLVADDQAVVGWQDGKPLVYPGRPILRMDRETKTWLEASSRRECGECGGKTFVRPSHAAMEEIALSHLYVLTDAEQVRSVPLSPQEGFASLIRHSFVGSLLTSSHSKTRLFDQCAALAQESPVRRLERPRSLAMLPDLARAIHDDIERNRF